MSIDLTFIHHPTQQHEGAFWEPRLQISAAASSASSPGRRRTSPPSAPFDSFTHQNTRYIIMRLTPGDHPAKDITPHRPVTATVHTTSGPVTFQARATAETPYLVHVAWIDEDGETFGTWCPKLSVSFDTLTPNN